MVLGNVIMRTIYFKNGTTVEITQEVANIIRDRTLSGCGKFQCFSNEKDDVYFIVNLEDVAYVA